MLLFSTEADILSRMNKSSKDNEKKTSQHFNNTSKERKKNVEFMYVETIRFEQEAVRQQHSHPPWLL